LVNIQFLGVYINEFDEREIVVVDCLLQSTTSLKIMDFGLLDEYEETQYTEFLERILELRRASTHA
jgi:hypothetical protein